MPRQKLAVQLKSCHLLDGEHIFQRDPHLHVVGARQHQPEVAFLALSRPETNDIYTI
jgi:hypothetical protein